MIVGRRCVRSALFVFECPDGGVEERELVSDGDVMRMLARGPEIAPRPSSNQKASKAVVRAPRGRKKNNSLRRKKGVRFEGGH